MVLAALELVCLRAGRRSAGSGDVRQGLTPAVPGRRLLISEPIARYFDDHFFAGG